MANRSLGTEQNSSGDGLDALTHRLILKALYPVCGIISGLDVTGSGAHYTVAAGTAVVSSSEADGHRVAHFDGGATPNVASGDASNQRIDSVYLKADDPITDNNSVAVRVGVVQGTPSASPVAPAAPAGTLLLAQFRVPAGSTSPAGSATRIYDGRHAISFDGNLGMLGENWNKSDQKGAPTKRTNFYEQPITFTLPTDRYVSFQFHCNFSNSKYAWNDPNAKACEWAVQFQLDGQDLNHAAFNFVSYGSWTDHYAEYTTKVTGGRHVARLRTWLQNGDAPYFHYAQNNGLWVGRRFQLFDRGMA